MSKKNTKESFLQRVELIPFHTCWEWKGHRNSDGYGHFSCFGQRNHAAHRASYRFFKSEIPEGLLVLHKCDNPGCVNPDHLFLGTDKDNSDDKISKGRERFTAAEDQLARTHCSRGHLYDDINTIIKKKKYGTGRDCRICDLERKRLDWKKNSKKYLEKIRMKRILKGLPIRPLRGQHKTT